MMSMSSRKEPGDRDIHINLQNESARLRWVEFPSNSRQALDHIESAYRGFLARNANANRQIQWQKEIMEDFVKQFVFQMVDISGTGELELPESVRDRLNDCQRLQLADIILAKLMAIDGGKGDLDRQNMFNTVFNSYNYKVEELPVEILSYVTSLAFLLKDGNVLNCISVWMMTTGLDDPVILQIASNIMNEFITDERLEKYFDLPEYATLFCAILLVAIGKEYQKSNKAVPQKLITLVTNWIETNPNVCFIPPRSSIFEIFRWVIKSEESQSRLHYGILQSLEKCKNKNHLQVIPHVMSLIHELKCQSEYSEKNLNNNVNLQQTEKIVERNSNHLYQLIQMLIATNHLDVNEIHPIFEACEESKIPLTPLYYSIKKLHFK